MKYQFVVLRYQDSLKCRLHGQDSRSRIAVIVIGHDLVERVIADDRLRQEKSLYRR